MRRATMPDMATSEHIMAAIVELYHIMDSDALDKEDQQVLDHVQRALCELDRAWDMQRVIDSRNAAKP